MVLNVDMKYKLVEVTNKKLVKEFLKMPVSLYKDDKNWIRPLDNDIEKIFDPNRNKFFKRGDAIRWVLYDANKKLVGRIAAFFLNCAPWQHGMAISCADQFFDSIK